MPATAPTHTVRAKPLARLHKIEGQRPGPVAGFLPNLLLDAVGALPASTRDAIARFVGWLAYTLGIRRRVVMDNLEKALPDLDGARHREIAQGAYTNMARVVLESIGHGDRLPRDWDVDAHRGDLAAWEALRAHVATGQGALLATAHFGNWELAGEMLIRWGVPLNALVRPLKGALNNRIVENRVYNAGAGLIYPKGAIAETAEALRLGESVYMLLDQALPAKAGVFVPFFGRLASTTPALAVAAQRTGMPVFVVMGVREGGRLRLHVEGPIPAPETGDPQERAREHTARVTAVLEKFVRQYPEQWMWLHRRWKVQPPGEN
ncbi:lysophospholipid acyltransferase family protein [Myxococcaceae bacterium GXIMD 01537]